MVQRGLEGVNLIQEQSLGKRPNWDEYFMMFAIVSSTRASCKNVGAGSIIVQNKQIIGTGYNGAPPQYPSCLEVGCRKANKGLEYEKSLGAAICRGVHAEKNALGHLTKLSTIGSNGKITLYTTIFPCHTCAKDLLPYNLERIVFKENYSGSEFEETISLFKDSDVRVDQLRLSTKRAADILFRNSYTKFGPWPSSEKPKEKPKSEPAKDKK